MQTASTAIEFELQSGNEVQSRWTFEPQAYAGEAITIAATGFNNTAANQDGAAFFLFGIRSNGEVFPLTERGTTRASSKTQVNNSLLLMPNPGNNWTNVYSTLAITGESTLRVFDQQGRQVDVFTFYGSQIGLDLTAYPNGVYQLRVSHSDGQTEYSRLQVVR